MTETSLVIYNPATEPGFIDLDLSEFSSGALNVTVADILEEAYGDFTNDIIPVWDIYNAYLLELQNLDILSQTIDDLLPVDINRFFEIDRITTATRAIVDSEGESSATAIGVLCNLIGSDIMHSDDIPALNSKTQWSGTGTDLYGAFRIPNNYGENDLVNFVKKITEKRSFYRHVGDAEFFDRVRDVSYTKQTFTSYLNQRGNWSQTMAIFTPWSYLRDESMFGYDAVLKASLAIKTDVKNVTLGKARNFNGEPALITTILVDNLNMSPELVRLLVFYFPPMSVSVLARTRPSGKQKPNFKVKITLGSDYSVDVEYKYKVFQVSETASTVNEIVGNVHDITQHYCATFLPTDLFTALLENAGRGEQGGTIRGTRWENIIRMMDGIENEARWLSHDFVPPTFTWATATWLFTKELTGSADFEGAPFGTFAQVVLIKNGREVVQGSFNTRTNRLNPNRVKGVLDKNLGTFVNPIGENVYNWDQDEEAMNTEDPIPNVFSGFDHSSTVAEQVDTQPTQQDLSTILNVGTFSQSTFSQRPTISEPGDNATFNPSLFGL